MTCMQWDTLFSRISNTLDNLPIARGDTSNESALGYEIITPNRLKLGRNNSRSLEGSGIDLEMSSNFTKILDRNRFIYQQWYQTFIDNVHLLNLRPNKWLKSDRIPEVSDIVLFVFNDSSYTKESICWKLGKVVDVQGNKVSLRYFMKTRVEQILVRSVRNISIVYSVGEILINTLDHFNECAKLSQKPEKSSKSLKEGVGSGSDSVSNDLASLAQSQPALGSPRVGSELGAEDAGQREDEVILNEDDSPMEVGEAVKDAAPVLVKAGVRSGEVEVKSQKRLGSAPVKRVNASSRPPRPDRARTHDELIEERAEAVVVVPDDLRVEIPSEVKDFKF